MPNDKQYTRQVTERFLKEQDRILGFDLNKKVRKQKQNDFVKKVGVAPNNLSRMKTYVNYNVTLEACIRMIHNYGTDPAWLFMGEDYEAKVDDRIKILDKMISSLGKMIKQDPPSSKRLKSKAG